MVRRDGPSRRLVRTGLQVQLKYKTSAKYANPLLSKLLTAGYFAEVNELWVWLGRIACRQVGVLVALVKPRIEVSRETAWRNRARFHAMFQRFELAEQLHASRNIKSFVNAENLH